MAEIDISWTEGERGNMVDRFDLIYFEPVDHIANMMLFRQSRYQSVNDTAFHNNVPKYGIGA